MRFKFKFWHKEDREFISIWSRGWRFEPENGQIYVNGMNVTERVEIIQFTGLQDRNGKEVYEGDIIKCTRGCQHVVEWVKSYGGTFTGGMPAFYLSGLNIGYSWTEEEEIIGNIYENPELLEATP